MEMPKEWKTYPGANAKELKKRGGIPFTEDNIGAIAIADTDGNENYDYETYTPDSIPKGAYEGMTPIQIGAKITEIVFMMYQHDCAKKKCNNGKDGGWISRLVCYRIPIQMTKNQWADNKFKLKYGSGKFVEGQIDGNILTFTKLFSIGNILSSIDLNKRITLGREYPLGVLFVKSEGESAAGEEDEDDDEDEKDEDFEFHFLDFLNIRLKF